MALRGTVTSNVCWIMWVLVFYSNRSLVSSSECRPPQAVPDIDQRTYSQIGDINIGVFIAASPSSGPSSCSKTVNPGSSVIEHTEAVAYAVKTVNENSLILPNVTLGFIQVNDCSNENVALAAALSFLPRVTHGTQSSATCYGNSSSASTFPRNADIDYTKCSEMPFYDVVGVIGPSTSQRTLAVSKLLSIARIPILGCLATSDELSDKKKHPYYSRITSPDKYQVDAMLQFIQSNNWSYISVIYVRDSFGQKAFDQLKEIVSYVGICVATSHRVDDSSNFDDVVRDLQTYSRARVVILFMYNHSSINLLNSVNNLNATGQFIWFWSDAWNTGFRRMRSDDHRNILGAFSVGQFSTYVPEYYRYLRQIKVNDNTNPWFKLQWEDLAGCSLSNESCDPNFDILTSDKFAFEKTSSLYIDAVNVFANALHNLISDICSNETGIHIRSCVKGETLLDYIRNVSFSGHSGRIHFDESGDRKGKYEIRQIDLGYKDIPIENITTAVTLRARTVAVYDVIAENLTYISTHINWKYVTEVDRLIPLSNDDPLIKVPESVCSRPCVVGEFKIQRELICCWECRMCRDNEKVYNGGTSCEACEMLTWPDPTFGYNSCSIIPPTYPLVTDTLPIILICLATGALLCASLVAIGCILFRDSRVIKAASRELSISQMVAIFMGYFTIVVFQTPPTHQTCGALFFLFCLSFSLIYAPLLVKTIRVFRIFQSGTKQNKRPKFISPCSQLVMAGVLIGIQILLSLCVYITYLPTAILTQPILTEKYVELSCDMTFPGLASFLTYNLVLVIMCSIFAFKTRHLPDNFNESKFVSMCVSTTLVIWLAFMPTYFTATRSSVRVMLLSVALLLNHTVALIFLFVPKIYAAIYVPSDNFVTSRFQTGIGTTDVFRHASSNRVSPSSVSPRKVLN